MTKCSITYCNDGITDGIFTIQVPMDYGDIQHFDLLLCKYHSSIVVADRTSFFSIGEEKTNG